MTPRTVSDTDDPTSYLPLLWYILMPAGRLKAGAQTRCEIFGCDYLLSRALDGRPNLHLAPDVFSGCEATMPCWEKQGLIWVFRGERADMRPNDFPCSPEAVPQICESVDLPCDYENAVYGLLDPAHVPYVHRSRWWRPHRRLREKEKTYEPHGRGFVMIEHASTQGELSYRLLGGDVTTEIVFELPGMRVETIRGNRGSVCSVTSLLPLGRNRTRMTHCLYWTLRGLGPLKPIIGYLTLTFLKEDQEVLTRQQEGLRYSPPQMLVGDADMPMKWFMRLSRAWRASAETGQPFVNPLKRKTLRWRT